MFHEDWYGETQIFQLVDKVKLVENHDGIIVEIGCWEGKSTTALANAVYPQKLFAVDTWKGNYDENPNNISVHLAKERNVLEEFIKNSKELTRGNIIPFQMDCFAFLNAIQIPIKFCHIDACHDYKSVRTTIELLIPKLVSGGILCGDDFITANMWREDLKGGVQKAVMDTCPGFYYIENFWWWRRQ
jgi:predicted O-methyltransferase YrrM